MRLRKRCETDYDHRMMMHDPDSALVMQLVYTSDLSEDTSDAEIFQMIRKAQKYNIAHEISGFLISDSKHLVQLIEGAEDQVNTLFHKIKMDIRHHNVQIKFQDQTDIRTMPFFGMGLCLVNSNVNYQQDFYFTRYQAKEFSSLFEGAAGDFFRQFLA